MQGPGSAVLWLRWPCLPLPALPPESLEESAESDEAKNPHSPSTPSPPGASRWPARRHLRRVRRAHRRQAPRRQVLQRGCRVKSADAAFRQRKRVAGLILGSVNIWIAAASPTRRRPPPRRGAAAVPHRRDPSPTGWPRSCARRDWPASVRYDRARSIRRSLHLLCAYARNGGLEFFS